MSERTRRSVLAAVGALSAGCLSNPGGSADETTTRGTTGTDETTREGTARASNSPDPDHSISLRNDAAEAETVRVRVVREHTDEVVFETTEEVPPGTSFIVYDLREADPDGIEPFRICAELVAESAPATTAADDSSGSDDSADSEHRDCSLVRTSECYGDGHVTVREGGSVAVIYAVC